MLRKNLIRRLNMSHYTYVIIGGGMTADAAVRGIREVDAFRSIGLFSMESDPPYNRPSLSKDLWKGTPMTSIWRKTEDQGVELHLGCKVERIDVQQKRIIDGRGTSYTFEKLLLATGGTPRKLPFGGDKIIYFRTLADYRRLQALAEKGQRFAVIGGGFIGSEIAAALASNGKQVTMIMPEQTIGSRVFPHDLGLYVNAYYEEKGVTLLTEEAVVDVEARGDFVTVKSRAWKNTQDREFVVDGVVAGIGIQPNVELAKAAGLQVDNGIVVDEYLRTSHPDIYAAGDVAAFYNPLLSKRIRVEHEDNANTMGRLAGRNMAGERENYDHLPSFYSDLFELSYEAVGELDPRLEIVTSWTDKNGPGAIYYLRESRVRGVLLWNIWGAVNAARELIAEPGPFKPEDLKKRLPLG
jgi:3-phenylpropionate/trans-cinnamate dioxygenase ferredoxin reductase component